MPERVFLLSSGVFVAGADPSLVNTNLLLANADAASDERCGVRRIGPCHVNDCRGEGPIPRGIPAGVINATNGSQSMTISSTDDGTYPLRNVDLQLWTPEDEITINVEGMGSLPPISMAFLFFPMIDLPDPELDALGNYPIVRSEELTIRWTPEIEGQVTVGILQSPPEGETWRRDIRIVCDFEASAGLGVVPSDVLSELGVSIEGGPVSRIYFGRSAVEELERGAYRIHAWTIHAKHFQAWVTN